MIRMNVTNVTWPVTNVTDHYLGLVAEPLGVITYFFHRKILIIEELISDTFGCLFYLLFIQKNCVKVVLQT